MGLGYIKRMPGLTDFRWKTLYVISGEDKSGAEIKRELEEYYGEEVNHGRLYPNLEDLVEEGFVNKGEYDKRTNKYSLTKKGEEMIREELEWQLSCFVTDENRKTEIEDLLSMRDDFVQH